MNKNAVKKPLWLKAQIPSGENYYKIKRLVKGLKLATVCESAACPNIGECWNGGTATLMLMGDLCSRGCRFCNVKTGNPKQFLDDKEPEKVLFTVSSLNLNYVVLTSVNRDDLEDEGSGHFARVIRLLKSKKPDLLLEVLTPDFSGREDCLETIAAAGPDVFAHNLETVERLSPKVRDPRASYAQSLKVLDFVKKSFPKLLSKSSLMLGLGESSQDILKALKDLRSVGCDILTFGQYLCPQKRHLPVERFVSLEEFEDWKNQAEEMGFLYCASGPLVRSSYRAGEFFVSSLMKQKRMGYGC